MTRPQRKATFSGALNFEPHPVAVILSVQKHANPRSSLYALCRTHIFREALCNLCNLQRLWHYVSIPDFSCHQPVFIIHHISPVF